MIYLIATEIRGVTYYVRVKNINAFRPDDQFVFEGLRNNATEFSKALGDEAMGKLRTEFPLQLISKNNT